MQTGTSALASYASPDAALAALLPELAAVGAESVDLASVAGRVLAQSVLADRDSPACDVSAVDGYAVRLADLHAGGIAVEGEASTGQPIVPLPTGRAMRIFTGGPVPLGAEAAIRREDTEESPGQIRLRVPPLSIVHGQDIRRTGENLRAGQVVVETGALITPALAAALGSFGAGRISVHRRVRVGVLTTGNEVMAAGNPVQPWQIRDANGPALATLLAGPRWVEPMGGRAVADDRAAIASTLEQMLASCDVVLVTGGVSMGDYDYVPDAVRDVGGRIIFHRLPIRPGKPVLGAVAPGGKAILGLPGNPVSVLVTARRLGAAVLARMAGRSAAARADGLVRIADADQRSLEMHWFRLVRLREPGVVELQPSRSSGDVAAAARADGFIEVPPGITGAGPFAFYRWNLEP